MIPVHDGDENHLFPLEVITQRHIFYKKLRIWATTESFLKSSDLSTRVSDKFHKVSIGLTASQTFQNNVL